MSIAHSFALDEEQSVLAGLVAGKTDRCIAAELSIPVWAVKAQVGRILEALSVTSRLQAALTVVRKEVGPVEVPEPEMKVLSIREDGSVEEHLIGADLFRVDSPTPFGLTERESQVLAGIIDGKTNEQIAADLGMHVKTVKARLKTIFGALGAANRTQAAVTAVRLQSAEGYGHATSVASLLTTLEDSDGFDVGDVPP